MKKVRRHNYISSEKIEIFQNDVLNWYPDNGRWFPWREEGVSLYLIIMSELLLQRTRAEVVGNFINCFIEKFPNWTVLDNTPSREVEEFIKPIGLWKRRTDSLKRLATVMVDRKGTFPTNREEVESLPGIGQYITNAIMMFCHGIPEPLLDGGMARVLERYFGPRKLADIRYDPYLQELSKKVVSCSKPIHINWAILDIGAKYCRPKKPKCDCCPLIDKCKFSKNILVS